MSETLAVLPGWGLGPAAVAPLVQALGTARPQASVTVAPLPNSADLETALNVLDQRLPPGAWLLGWSLGGMLAVALAARRGQACPGVITFASNASFIAREGWPAAMALETYTAFAGQCEADPTGTLKRFGLLCVQGSEAGRGLIKPLLADTRHATAEGLALLAALDNRDAIAALALPQLHVFATRDALVPVGTAAALAQLAPHARVTEREGSHAFVLESPDTLAAMAAAFIEAPTHA